jgi:hypothetical protein
MKRFKLETIKIALIKKGVRRTLHFTPLEDFSSEVKCWSNAGAVMERMELDRMSIDEL